MPFLYKYPIILNVMAIYTSISLLRIQPFPVSIGELGDSICTCCCGNQLAAFVFINRMVNIASCGCPIVGCRETRNKQAFAVYLQIMADLLLQHIVSSPSWSPGYLMTYIMIVPCYHMAQFVPLLTWMWLVVNSVFENDLIVYYITGWVTWISTLSSFGTTRSKKRVITIMCPLTVFIWAMTKSASWGFRGNYFIPCGPLWRCHGPVRCWMKPWFNHSSCVA